MAYAEGSSYLTHAQLQAFCDSAAVADVIGDSAASLVWREVASGVLDERAIKVGLTPPLASAVLTRVMLERLAWVSLHRGASKRQEYRDGAGVAPYRAEHDRAMKEIDAWTIGDLPSANETPTEVDPVGLASNRRRGL